MRTKRRLLTLIVTVLLLFTVILAAFSPWVSAEVGSKDYGSSPYFGLFDEAVNFDRSQYYSNAIYPLPEGVDDEEEISIIVQTKKQALLEAYDESGLDISFTDYCNMPEANAVREKVDEDIEALTALLDEQNIPYTVGEEYSAIFTGFELLIKAGSFENVCWTFGNDVNIIVGEVYEAAEAEVVENSVKVYDTGIFDSSDSGFDGSGTVVAILDTGYDYTHSAFSVNNFTSTTYGLTYDEVKMLVDSTTASTFHEALSVDDVYINVKIPYAYDYADKDTDVISPEILEPIQRLKTKNLGNHNPRLHTDEVLIALAVSAANSDEARRAIEAIGELKHAEVHSTVILSQVDTGTFRKLGVNLSCEPRYQTKKLFHR